MELQFILEALKILGIYRDKDSSFIFRLCRYITIIQFLILHVFVGLQFISGTVYIRVNIIYYFLVAATIIGGSVYISSCGKRIRYIIELLEGDLPGVTNFGEMMREEIRMKFRSERYIRRYCIFVFSHTIVTMLIIIGSFVIFRTIATMIGFTSIITTSSQGQSTIPRFLMYVMWWPTNIREIPTYYYILAWQCFNGVYTIAITNVINAFTSSLLLAASSRAEMLAKTAKACLVPLRNNPKSFSKKFRTWLCKHQRYLTLIEEVNKITGPLVFTAHFLTLTTIITCIFATSKFNDTTMSATIIIVMLEKILQMAIMSYAGQKVIDSSLLLSHSVLSSSQIDTGVLSAAGNTSALQVLHTRTSGPISKVSGLGFFTVSMEFFASVLSASTTYLLFLLQFKAVGGPTAYEVPKE